MTDVKIKIKVGSLEFYAEGDKEWVSKHLDKIIDKADSLSKIAPPSKTSSSSGAHTPMGSDPEIAQKPLASFLKDKNATRNQNMKFLATAVWLEAKGNARLKPSDITKALKDANQKRLGNPSETLSQNVNKGYCERDGSQFYVTQEGKDSL